MTLTVPWMSRDKIPSPELYSSLQYLGMLHIIIQSLDKYKCWCIIKLFI